MPDPTWNKLKTQSISDKDRERMMDTIQDRLRDPVKYGVDNHDTRQEAADHIDRLLALLRGRDEYLVETDNWDDFIESLARNQ